MLREECKENLITRVEIEGYNVEIYRFENKNEFWFSAYVKLTFSNILKDDVLGYPTYRKGNIVGVDTGHAFNQKQTEVEKFVSVITQITHTIKQYKKLVKTD